MSEMEHRHRKRHQVLTPVFFMLTEAGKPLDDAQHHIEGEAVDISEQGFRLRSSHLLEEGEQISFEITSSGKTILRGVGEIMHALPDMVYGVQYLKVKKS